MNTLDRASVPGWARHLRPAHLVRAAALLTEVRRATLPADRSIEAFLRRHREMGRRDRLIVTETVFGCLRHARLLRALLDSDAPTALLECAACLVAVHGLAPADLPARELDASARTRLQAAADTDRSTLPFAVQYSLPDWLAASLLTQFETAEAERLAGALNEQASLDLRANTLRTDREALRLELAQAGWSLARTPWSPAGLRHADRLPMHASPAYRAGRVEIQDEASQLVGYLLAPAPGERVVDLCAGGGGKTLHLGALMGDEGWIDACDVAPGRLEQLRVRAGRAGLHIVHSHVLDAARAPDLAPADAVLVDAPCSGSGTLRRHPHLKWRETDVPAYATRQGELLDTAARLVRPGGRLVYATCSLLAEENDRVIESFLDAHAAFEIEPAGAVLASAAIAPPGAQAENGALRLLPHRHATDGFYAVRLRRRG